MKFLARIIFHFLVNLVALMAVPYFVAGFSITNNIQNLLVLTAVFTVINMVLKPLLKLIFSPFIFLTLGLFSLVINAIILKLIDIWSVNLTISDLQSLAYATLIITGVNLILTFVAKSSFKE